MNNLNLESEETKEFYPSSESIKDLQEIFEENDLTYDCNNVLIGNGWVVNLAESVGGGEGDGETYYLVYSFTKDSKVLFFKIPGWYQSYDGGELYWNKVKGVKPKQKMITYYE